MSKQNAMVQFYDGKKIVLDTELLTLEAAKELFNAHLDAFKDALERGANPELVLWYPCKNGQSYVDSVYHLSSASTIVQDGKLFVQF